MNQIEVKVKKLIPDARVPAYGRDGDAGLDLHASAEYFVYPGGRSKIGTGLAMEIPFGFVGLVWDRSGMATIRGAKTMAGVIDSNYRGEIFVTVLNTGLQVLHIRPGDKIAQLLIQPVYSATLVEVDELSPSERGDEALGSSGR